MATVTQYSRHPFQAFGLAVIIECAVLAATGVVLANSESSKPALSVPVPIVLATEEPEVIKPPEPKPEEPKPISKPVTQAPPPPQQTPPPVASVPTAFTEPTPPPPPPPPVDTSPAKPTVEYLAKVKAAVKAAHTCPAAAVSLNYKGRVRVDFRLHDTVPSDIKILVASSFGMIDRAAVQAVQNANYPEQTAEMRGTDYVYQVWIECN